MRSNVFLPADLERKLREKSEATGLSPSQIFRGLFEEEKFWPTQEELEVSSINLSWGEQENQVLEELQSMATVKRGNKEYPVSKHKIFEIMLRKYFG